jgi:hypothetical protein
MMAESRRTSTAQSALSGAAAGRWLALLVVVAIVGIALTRYATLWLDHREFTNRVVDVLRLYDTQPPPYGPDDARADVVREAKRLGIPLSVEQVQIADEGRSIRVRLRYQRPYRFPGLSRELHFQLDRSWSGP